MNSARFALTETRGFLPSVALKVRDRFFVKFVAPFDPFINSGL